jgi:hypothetical protein
MPEFVLAFGDLDLGFVFGGLRMRAEMAAGILLLALLAGGCRRDVPPPPPPPPPSASVIEAAPSVIYSRNLSKPAEPETRSAGS